MIGSRAGIIHERERLVLQKPMGSSNNGALMLSSRALAFLCLFLLTSACEEKPKTNPFDPPADAPKPAPPASAIPKREGPPEFAIDTIGPKIGFARALLEQREGRDRLAEELALHKKYIEGQSVQLEVDRKAKVAWVSAYLDELGKLGAKDVSVKTETRKEFPGTLTLTPEINATDVPNCSVVAMVVEDRGTAVWKLSGGVAGKRAKGMAGPDLSMTGETIERVAKSCRESNAFFFSVAEGIEWGLAYDLAASTRALEKTRFDKLVLLREIPVPGHPVKLKK